MSERMATPAELKRAVKLLGAHLLHGVAGEAVPSGSVRDYLPAGVVLPPAWEQKGERYGRGNAISGLMRTHAVAGRGPDAQFRYPPPAVAGKPRTRLLRAVRQIFATTAQHFNGIDGHHTVVMDEYTAHGKGLPPGQGTIKLGQAVLGGGDYLHGITEYTCVTADLMASSPAYADASAELKRDRSHGIITRAMGREASLHSVDFIKAETADELHRRGEVQLRTDAPLHGLDFGDHRRAAALRGGDSYDTPPLACPAHQLRAGEPETDLETFIHAGINLAYTYQVYGRPEQPAA
jgi:hypothetical protein